MLHTDYSMASSQVPKSGHKSSTGFGLSSSLEKSFGSYFKKTKDLASSVVTYLSPDQEQKHEANHTDLDSMTSSNESESLSGTLIDSILSVPESDEEKSSMDVLQPYVLTQAASSEQNISGTQKEGYPQKNESEMCCQVPEDEGNDTDEADVGSLPLQECVNGTVDSSQCNINFGEKEDRDSISEPSSLNEEDLDKLEKMQNAKEPGIMKYQEELPISEDHIQDEGKPECPTFFIGDGEDFKNPSLRIFMFGKTGSGKSCTANTILGTDAFHTSKSFGSVTLTGKRTKATRFGFDLEIIDTPGLLDNRSNDSSFTENEIIRSAILSSPGFHVALFIMQYGRITKEDELTLKTFRKFFGENVLENAILVFTSVDTPEEEEALENDVNYLSSKQVIEEQTKLQQELLQCFAFKYFVMKNRGSQAEKMACAEELVGIIARLSHNGEKYYTSPIFRQLEDAFTYMVRDEETKYLVEIMKLQKELTDELAIMQVIPKIQVDFLYQLIQYRTWSQLFKEKGQLWDRILEKLHGKESAELSLEEIEHLKEEQKWRDTGRQIHQNFMDAIRELLIHNQKALAPRVKTFEKEVARMERVYNIKCTEARERMKMEAETSLKSFLSDQGWNKLISAGLVIAAVGGSFITFGPLLGSVLGVSVATKVMAAASAAYMGFWNWKK